MYSTLQDEFRDNCKVYGLPLEFSSSKKRRQPQLPIPYINRTVQEEFSKKFTFTRLTDWYLPEPSQLFKAAKWQDERLVKLKFELNKTKNKLNNFDLKDWHRHTTYVNYAGDVIKNVRLHSKGEFITQAWCKFYEIVNSYKLIPDPCIETNELASFHLCEAPGAFISSLNHFIQTNHPGMKWRWKATTLNPYYEGNKLSCMINNDKFILNTLENWWFGHDGTGDLFNPSNLPQLADISKQLVQIYLVTADGSIDCQTDPGEQESNVVPLHFVETLAALNTLTKGGSYLMKMFTMFECDSVCLLYLLSCAFGSVDVFKPVTSKRGNSEVYVICLDYIGQEDLGRYLPVLNQYFTSPTECRSKALFKLQHIPQSFIEQVVECANLFKTIQETVIEGNISSYHNSNFYDRAFLKEIKRTISKRYMSTYSVKAVEPHQLIVNPDQLANTLTLNLDEKTVLRAREIKTYLDVEDPNFLNFAYHCLTSAPSLWDFEDDVYLIQLFQEGEKIPILDPMTSKPLDQVHSSKFCSGQLILLSHLLKDFDDGHYKSEQCSKLKDWAAEDYHPNLQLDHLDVCDVSSFDWITDVHSVQTQVFDLIRSAIGNLKLGHSLLIIGCPLLTRFNVGLLYIIGFYFERIGFMNPNRFGYGILLHSLRDLNVSEILKSIQERLISESVVSLLPIRYLCGGDWYYTVTVANHVVFKGCISGILNSRFSTQLA